MQSEIVVCKEVYIKKICIKLKEYIFNDIRDVFLLYLLYLI